MQIAERGNVECPICLTQLDDLGIKTTSTSASTSNGNHSNASRQSVTSAVRTATANRSSTQDKKSVAKSKRAALTSTIWEQGAAASEGEETTRRRHKAVLSCCHIFHQTCLEAFEQLTIGERHYCCPVCRSHYQKLIVWLLHPSLLLKCADNWSCSVLF